MFYSWETVWRQSTVKKELLVIEGIFIFSHTHLLTTISGSCVFSDYKEVTDEKFWLHQSFISHKRDIFGSETHGEQDWGGSHEDKGPSQF